MADLNYDEIRVGNVIEIAAKRHADDYLRDNHQSASEFERNRIYKQVEVEKREELIREFNAQKMREIPINGLQINELNKDTLVVRYTLRDDVSIEQAENIHEKWIKAKLDPEFISSDQAVANFEEALDSILKEAFEIHRITMEEAAKNDLYKRFPSDCLIIEDDPIDQIIANESKPVVEKPVEKSSPFDTPDISADALVTRLEQLEMTHIDLSKVIGVHHKTVEKWTREGVPSEHKTETYKALT